MAFTIGDADAAGKTWLEPGGFVEQLRPRCKRVWCFLPAIAGMKDFNDLHKARLITREQMLETLRDRMRRPRAQRKETFLSWCKAQAVVRADNIGMAAYLVAKDKARPKGRGARAQKVWERHWLKTANQEHLPWLRAAWNEWSGKPKV